jgi:hypothetical protein
MKCLGRAVAQAVSRWLPTAAPWVRVRAACRVCGGQSDRIFSEYFGFPCQSFHQFLHIIITRGWHNRPISGRSAEWAQLDSTHHYTN